MNTLYDVLGALPHDDAEGLRTAFRRAVKGTHPDIRPGDPDAAVRFREIVRANEILCDAEQRAAYDHLLDLARLEQETASKYAVAARIHKLASGVIAFAGASIVTVGGYLLFMHMSAASVASTNNADVVMHASAEIAAISPARAPDTTDNRTSFAKRESTGGDASVPSTAKSQSRAESVPAANVGLAPDLAASKARSLRALGVSAYRNGDVNGSIAYLDQALQLDPTFLPAYIDRGIIFYRLQKFDRAFPNVAPAKRIDKASRSKSAPTMASKQPFEQAAVAPQATLLPERRTFAQDPSREEGFAFVRMR